MAGIRHGGALDRAIARYGGSDENWLDLSTGINPVPYPVPRMPSEIWQRLPDDNLVRDCLAAARACYGVPEGAAIIAAPGTQAIIQWLPVLFNNIDRAAVISPAYGEYEHVLRTAGIAVSTPDAPPRPGDAPPMLVVGQPNNPDGRAWAKDRLAPLIAADSGVRALVADEAFADVAPEHSLVGLTGDTGLLVLRSFGKFFGLAGARLGFAIGNRDVIESLGRMLGPWAVSGPALHLASVALRDADWIAETRERLADDRLRLAGLLARHGFEIVGGTDLFVLVSHGRAAAISRRLAERHILVRAFERNAEWLRFGLPGSPEDFDRLAQALDETA